MKHFFILFILSALSVTSSAQNNSADTQQSFDLSTLDLEGIQLPPISVFLDAAKNYADVKYYDEKREEEALALKVSKKEWLKYLRLQANYQYGTNSALLTESSEQTPSGLGYATINTQSWYNVGAVLSIPLDDLFARKNKNDMVRARIRQIDYESEKALENRQLIILESYNEVLKHLSTLKVKAEAVALYNAQMAISEKDYVNGRITIIDLSLERGRRATAIVAYQDSRAALHNAVTLLEMLTKIRIIQK